MPRFRVQLTRPAERDLEGLKEKLRLRVLEALTILEESPFRHVRVKKLRGLKPPHYRLRIGDYRAIYRVSADMVVVLRVIHRRELERVLGGL